MAKADSTPKPIEKISRKDMADMSYQEVMKVGKTSYRRLLHYVKPYKLRFATGIFFGILSGASQGAFLIALAIIMSVVLKGTTQGAAGLPTVDLSRIPFVPEGWDPFSLLPENMQQNSVLAVGAFAAFIPLLILVRGALAYISNYCLIWVGNRILYDIRNELFQRLLAQPLNFFTQQKTGDLMQTVFNQTRMASSAALELVKAVSKHPFEILSTLIVIILMDPLFAFCSLIVFPLCMVPVIVISKKVRKAGGKEEEEAGMLMVNMQESFSGIRVVKSHAREDYESVRFEKGAKGMLRFMMRWQKAQEIVGPLVETVASVGIAAGLFYAWYMKIPAAVFFPMVMGLMLIYPPAKALSRIQVFLAKCIVATTRVFAFIDRQPEILDKPDAIDLENTRGHIWLNGVSFHYKPGIPALKDVMLEMEQGQFYALVGPSGAGKSTLFSLLMRFYDPTQGTIEVDGNDLRDVTQNSLRDNIGLVSQDTFLFHDTIMNNIRYGRLEATDEECIAAAKAAYAHEFILEQEKGYKTITGDQGCALSGGQKQRISIARAILRNPPILLLDEAMSALDTEAEKKVQEAIEILSEGKTVIAIAHRLSTVLHADQIVVMDNAEVVDTGSHQELLETSPLYQRLYQLQFKGEADLAEADAAAIVVEKDPDPYASR